MGQNASVLLGKTLPFYGTKRDKTGLPQNGAKKFSMLGQLEIAKIGSLFDHEIKIERKVD
jgi:hypothetical protein